LSRAKHGLPPWIQAAIPPGPPIGCEYRVPEGHPCYGCRMYTNPCLYPCNKTQVLVPAASGKKFVNQSEND